MKEFKCLVRSSGSIATLAAGILLLAAAPGNAGHHGNNSGQGRGDDTRRTTDNRGRNDIRPILAERRGSDKPNFDHAKFDRFNKHGNEQANKHEKRSRDAERLGDGKQKMAAPVGKPVEAAGGKPPQTVASNPVASSSGSPTGVTPPVNTIHPILSPPAGNVTVSNGVTKYEIPNGAGGVSAYSSGPGRITVTNGKDSVTLNGGSVTVSNALGVGAAQNNVQVGARNGEGKTVVSVAPQKAPTTAGNVTTGPGSITVTGSDLKTAGKVVGAVGAAPVAVVGTAADLMVGAAVVGAVEGVGSFTKAAAKDAWDLLGF